MLGLFCIVWLATMLLINGIQLIKSNEYFPILASISLGVSGITEMSANSTTGWFIFLIAVIYSISNKESFSVLDKQFIIQANLHSLRE